MVLSTFTLCVFVAFKESFKASFLLAHDGVYNSETLLSSHLPI